jgi:hypothetical protein
VPKPQLGFTRQLYNLTFIILPAICSLDCGNGTCAICSKEYPDQPISEKVEQAIILPGIYSVGQ